VERRLRRPTSHRKPVVQRRPQVSTYHQLSTLKAPAPLTNLYTIGGESEGSGEGKYTATSTKIDQTAKKTGSDKAPDYSGAAATGVYGLGSLFAVFIAVVATL
jgi:hypothetical protein